MARRPDTRLIGINIRARDAGILGARHACSGMPIAV
jgi:hypothetical protein